MKSQKYFSILFVCFCFNINLKAQHFASLQNGTQGGQAYIRTMFTDTVTNLLYVSGGFFHAGAIYANRIASWNGTSWDSLGRGLRLNSINTGLAFASGMCRYNNELYIGGAFIKAGNVNATCIAHWDGNTWYAMPQSPNGQVNCIMVYNNELIIGGASFDSVGNLPVNGLAKWDGSSWSNAFAFPYLQGGGGNNQVYCMAEYQGHLFVAGNFCCMNQMDRIVYWDGVQWHGMPNGGIIGLNDWVDDMVVYNHELYVAGYFHTPEGNIGNNIQKWNGTVWSGVGGGTGGGADGQIWKLIVFHNKLYALGNFQFAGGVPANNIASWDGTNWCGLGSTFDNGILTGAIYKDSLYVGGGFGTIDGDSMNYIAKWIGGNYTAGCTSVGVDELGMKNEEMELYPNPCAGQLTVNSEQGIVKEIKIVNVLGELITEKRISTNETKYEMDVSGLAKGLYFVEVRTEKGIKRKKFVKQ